jgi:hypothetical protein
MRDPTTVNWHDDQLIINRW